jgi:hypothetical protein
VVVGRSRGVDSTQKNNGKSGAERLPAFRRGQEGVYYCRVQTRSHKVRYEAEKGKMEGSVNEKSCGRQATRRRKE